MAEQFCYRGKVICPTGAKGKLERVKINQPERQPDGSVRYLNDITSSLADYIVSERDYTGCLRQAMFDSPMPSWRSCQKLAFACWQWPTTTRFAQRRREIAGEIRRMMGERDSNQPMTPEEAAEQEASMRQRLEAMEQQRQLSALTVEEQRAKVRGVERQGSRDRVRASGTGVDEREISKAVMEVQAQAADQIDAPTNNCKLQAEVTNRTMQIKSDADVAVERGQHRA